ncbi:transglutaminase-like domain-containing protein [Mongoliibacter ruber]|uniref:Transglutaminase superfamily protein n=1 Tax=Mongoliibacter ruber TaxID=1750599 RepID=A0A2T0WLD0_9BACT|nr:transglutaminase-like domain-containing protein [Mongoliibacter ruber]PRY87485.1 transglutaminase superfamily protein [Mongoliibacter ruber]
MESTKILNISLLCIFLIFSSCNKGEQKKETDVGAETTTEKVSIEEIEEGIKAYIEKETKSNDGFFLINDEKHELRLKLVRVHTEYLSNLGPQKHFACVDLADEKGDVYDVDFFLEGQPGNMTVTETSLHKLNGKPFYTWKQVVDKTWRRVPVEAASTELLGVVEGTDDFEFKYEAVIPQITQTAKAWIPLAKTDNFQQVDLISMDIPVTHKILDEKEFGNKVVYLELSPEDSGKRIELIYDVKRKEKNPYEVKGEVDARYLQPNLLMPIGGRFSEIAEEAIKGKESQGKLVHARALYDYIIDNMRYMKFGEYGTGNSVLACDSKTGNCTEFHSLFISLARSIDIPARFSIGASIPSDRDDGGIDGYHCWAEFYAEGKWWPVDISEGNKYTALATYYFGRHPANRIELSQGRDLVVEPGPKSGPINFLAYPIMESESGELFPKTTFSFVRKQL